MVLLLDKIVVSYLFLPYAIKILYINLNFLTILIAPIKFDDLFELYSVLIFS